MHEFFLACLSLSVVKYLFIPAYLSTDFEVHRNWLAITRSLPLDKWYYDETSVWTLDYPPFFAWLEYLLAKFAVHVDPGMVKLENLNYRSKQTVWFQRSSVIMLDFIYYYGVYSLCRAFLSSKESGKSNPLRSTAFIGFLLLLSSPGLLMVDHMHFQYNGFLSGLLFLSVAAMMEGRCLQSAFWFSVLLNFKHIYLYMAPAYFVYLLFAYCGNGGIFKFFRRVFALGAVVISIFGISFGPFATHILQVLSRLFPFKRGLCHAYWAPNVWAVYNLLDKVLTTAGTKLGYLKTSEPEVEPIIPEYSWLSTVVEKTLEVWNTNVGNLFGEQSSESPVLNVTSASMTGGLVQQFEHVILPSVPPKATFVLTALSLLPIVFALAKRKTPQAFIEGLVCCSLSSYLFGWHVHEKAILLPLLPLTVLAVKDQQFIRPFLLLSITGHVSLFPLLFTPFESVLKLFLVAFYSTFSVSCLSIVHSKSQNTREFLKSNLSKLEVLYLSGLLPVSLHEVFLHKFTGLHDRMAFLPLLLMSVYCAFGVIYSWCILLRQMFVTKKMKSE